LPLAPALCERAVEVLRRDLIRDRGNATPPSTVYCADKQTCKNIAATLIRDVGFEPVDAGPLRMARYMEPFTLLIAQLAYEGTRGPELSYRFEWLGKR